MYRLSALSAKSLPIIMASICGHYMYEHIRHNTIVTKSEPNFTIKALKTLRNARLEDTDVAAKMRNIYKEYQKSVVTINSHGGDVLGTGFVVDASGLIVTNCHVVDNFPKVTVKQWKGDLFANDNTDTEALKGQVVYAEPALDLALVRVFVKDDSLPALTLRTDITAGEPVLALGCPDFMYGIALGHVIGADRPHNYHTHPHDYPYYNMLMNNTDTFLEHSAATVPGFSGGPLLDLSGRVVGVNYGGGNVGNYCTNAIDVQEFVTEGREHETLVTKQKYAMAGKKSLNVALKEIQGIGFKVTKLGITDWTEVSDETNRLLVGDIITQIDGKPLLSFTQLEETLQSVGSVLNIEVKRNGGITDIKVTPLFTDNHNCSAF